MADTCDNATWRPGGRAWTALAAAGAFPVAKAAAAVAAVPPSIATTKVDIMFLRYPVKPNRVNQSVLKARTTVYYGAVFIFAASAARTSFGRSP